MEKVMRDLADSLERENDLKEQLKYSGVYGAQKLFTTSILTSANSVTPVLTSQ